MMLEDVESKIENVMSISRVNVDFLKRLGFEAYEEYFESDPHYEADVMIEVDIKSQLLNNTNNFEIGASVDINIKEYILEGTIKDYIFRIFGDKIKIKITKVKQNNGN